MIRVLLALLALLAPGLIAPHSDPGEHIAPAEPTPATQAFRMPAADSWIAWSFHAQTDSVVTLTVREPPSAADTRMHATALLFDLGEGPLTGGGAGQGSALFAASIGGRAVDCCSVAIARGASGESSIDRVEIPAGRTVWLTFIGARLETSQGGRLNVDVHEGTLIEGERRQGTRVALDELVEKANDGGTRVQLASVRYALDEGEAEARIVPQQTGFLMASLVADGDARMRAWASSGPDAALHPTGLSRTAALITLMGTQPLAVAISDLEQPPRVTPLDGHPPAYLAALVLTADLDVPGESTQVHMFPLNS